MRSKALLLSALLAVATASAARADAIEEATRAVPLTIEDVRTLSGWKRADASGLYRVVAAQQTGPDGRTSSRLFIQWLELKPDGSRVLLDSVEIREVDALKAKITDYTFETGEDELALFLEIAGGSPDAEGSYELFVRSPSDYRFGRLSN